jgi:hypothetical protein
MSNRTIYDALRAAGLTAEGACGLMGNMYAESTMKSNIAQRGMTNLSDEDYTALADNGIPVNGKDFANDSVGYGLCQWTDKGRKRNLLAFCKARGASVGDEQAQVAFCLQELQREYPMLLLELRSSHDMRQCAADVCTKFERPAVNNIDERYRYAQRFYNDFCGSGALNGEHTAAAVIQGNGYNDALAQDACPIFPPDPSVMTIQLVMQYNGYWGKPDGYKSPEFFTALRTFTDDMEKC